MVNSNVKIRRRFTLFVVSLFVIYAVGVEAGSSVRSHPAPVSAALEVAVDLEVTITSVVSGLTSPIYVTNAHDGTNRLFIVEQGGIIKVLQPGSSTPTVFLDITSKVLSGGERGLLGLAFHPQYETNRRFFVNYTRTGDGATVIAGFQASAGNPNVADTTETIFLTIAQPFSNHNGGMIEFGQDGFLYIGMGDGGSANDPGNRAQNINDLLGKMLRINIDQADGGNPYSSPSSNPFFGATPGRDEIYAVGFRNPFRWSFDRQTGQLYAGDVGQGVVEEIDLVTLGGNYGWRVFEGTRCTNLDPPLCSSGTFIAPITEYNQTPGAGGRCAVIGGYVYRGTESTLPAGAYLYGDLCTGEFFVYQGGQANLLLDTNLSIASFGEDEAGELYVVELGGTIYRLDKQTTPDVDTVGLYAPSGAAFFLRNSNSSGTTHTTVTYGPANLGWLPLTGDWNGDGIDTLGLYAPSNSGFFLRNSNTGGIADLTFIYGSAGAGWIPLAGDWDGDGTDTIGLYDPANSAFFLRNTNSSGMTNISFSYGPGGLGWVPIVGDWNGDGIDTVGLYAPTQGAFFLRNTNSSGVADISFTYGPANLGWVPIAGDWNGDGTDTIGLYDPANSAFFLRNTNSSGIANITFAYGSAGAGLVPIVRDWDGL